jgi:phosphatidylinositol alpha-1,6-mannosyltransferase
MGKILLLTRPIAPPWDEASKNFAYYLATHGKKHEYTLLTKKTSLLDTPKTVNQLAIYTKNHLDAKQKIKILKLYGKRNDFDVIHYMLTPSPVSSNAFKMFMKSKKAKTVQTIATLRDDKYTVKDFKKILFGDILVTYSDFAKRKLSSIGFENVERIYPGINLDYYRPAPKDDRFAKSLGINRNDFVVTYPGEYVRLGATDDIIAVLPKLVEAISSLKFLFACRIKNQQDAKKKQEIIKRITNSQIKDHVLFTDTVSDMPALFNASDIVIFPVRDMTGKFDVPLTVIEAMACAKPVIISDLPVLAEFSNDRNSVIISTGDNKALLEQVVVLYADSERRLRLGEAAFKHAVRHFDINKIAGKYEKLYKSLIQDNAS